ncbi:diguanylate cyclase/phosphodiesterase (GGDEF & EAL domains) with PAS/PAC sensor(s) [hydrothermal vent metagenome]|uniref:Diguanylate cyclase/phosphodiesterase (GGDEF & EAL domains) with PAS/PAC sensor(S) n=1 Tax=hydrothermal vent metagenome TaxID=652676 RepID=A0A3B0X6A5_9ZZZZ
MFILKKWFLNSISRQVSLLLVLILGIALLLPAFYFYNTQKKEINQTTEQLTKQLIQSIKTSISKPLLFNDYFSGWQIINKQIINNRKQVSEGGLFKISEIAILDKKNKIFAHSSPENFPLQKKYTSSLPTTEQLPINSQSILITHQIDEGVSSIRLYSNAIFQGNRSGLIILQVDLSRLDKYNREKINSFIIYFISTITLILFIGVAFGKWISAPLNKIEKSLVEIGNGKLNLTSLIKRHDEYSRLAIALSNTDKDLHKNKSQVELLLDSTAEAIYGIDIEGCCTFVNKSCLKILGYTDKSEIIGKNMYQLLHKSPNTMDTYEKNISLINSTLIANKKMHIDNEYIWRKDATNFHAEYWSYPIIEKDELVGAVVTFIDVTDRIESLKKLKEREQYLSLMLHSIGDAVIATDEKGIITRMNPVAEKLTGWKFKEARNKTVKEVFIIIDASTRMPINNPIEKVMRTGEIIHLRNHTSLISKNGKEYHIADSAAPIRNEKGIIQGMVLVFNDVTEQYILRNKINEQQQKLQRIFDGMQSFVVILDIDGTLTFINETPLKLFNLSSDDVLGKKLWNLNFCSYDEKVQKDIKENCLQAASGKLSFNDIPLSTPKGLFWIELSIHPLLDESGNIIQLVAEGRDINQRKQQENILHRSQKMDAIGQLAGGIAHDFNNQLGVVIGYLDILQSTLHDEKQLQWIDNSSRATLRCIDLTRQLLTFSRNKPTNKTVIDINKLLQNLKNLIKRTVTPQVEVQYKLDDDLWLTDTDQNEFQDAILNLVINARDALPNGGKLIIETSNQTFDSDYATNQFDTSAGDYVQIAITDTGTGMDKKTLNHIFEPFFTTKEEGKGTGLGLAMVYSFVKRYHGNIRFHSDVNIGTTIHIVLPRSTYKSITKTSDKKTTQLPKGNESILIVEDEVDLLELASQYLTDLGYKIKTAENGQQALNILSEDSSIDLLFSDVVMPGGITGYELAEKIATQWPHIKILLTSGFTSKVKTKKSPSPYDENLISKPYRKAELAKHVRLKLDENKQ